ncbi:MAG: winged helix DNA-binding domain-containing protein [Nocardioidaceae bacterium]
MPPDTLSHRVLNRTLLQRQHLLTRATLSPADEIEHLLGLQAQEALPPYVSLWSRLRDLDPTVVSAALERRTAVRLLLMRGTIHLVSPRDALLLRALVQPQLDRQAGTGQDSRRAAEVDRDDLRRAVATALADGPVPFAVLGELLGGTFPGVPETALAQRARCEVPLVQVPPRGLWQRSGGVVVDLLQSWVADEPVPDPDPAEVVRRYLCAYGPASAADVTTWSGITGMRAVLRSLEDELVPYRDERGRALVDLAGVPLAEAETPAPVRLLGRYDNLWLSHADRDRVTPDREKRGRWMGSNGGLGATVFVDGALEGLWRRTPSGRVDVELFRRLTGGERADLDTELDALETFLA